MVLSLSELASYQNGQNVGDFGKNVARAGRDVVCGLYGAYPDYFTYDPLNTGLGAFRGGLLDSLCQKVPPSPNPDGRPVGVPNAQCQGLYTITIGFSYDPVNGGARITGNSGGQLVNGPIKQLRSKYNREAGEFGSDEWSYLNPLTGQRAVIYTTSPLRNVKSWVQSIVPNPGVPDNCGSDPVPPRTEPPPGLTRGPVNVPVPVPTGPTINLPVIIPVIIPLKPTIDVQVGPIRVEIGPVDVNLFPNPDFTINLPSQPSPPLLPPGAEPPSVPRSPSQPVNCPDVNLKPIADKLDDLDELLREVKECACGPDKILRIQAIGGGNSGILPLPVNTVAVLVTNVEQPPSVKWQRGNDGPNVLFAGWYAFGRTNNFSDRKPIDYRNNYYLKPGLATQFSFTLKDNSTCDVAAIVEEVVNP